MDLIKKNGKVQGLLLLLVALVVADAGLYFLRTAPAKAEVSRAEERLTALRSDLRAKEDEYRLYRSFEKGRADIDAFKGMLPGRSEYIEIIRKVYRLAREDGMKSSSFGTEKREVKQEGDLVQLSFTMPVSGSYKDVRKFIHDVESSDLFLNIDSLGLSAAPESDTISLSMGLSTYMRS